jgi:hypothetical protein
MFTDLHPKHDVLCEAKAIIISSMAEKLKFCTDLHPKRHVSCRVMVIQNMLFCAEWSSSKTCWFVQSDFHPKHPKHVCFVQSDLHPKHVVLCRVIFHPKHVVLCVVLFIQNMLFCAVWSSSKTWCAVFQSRRWCFLHGNPFDIWRFFCLFFGCVWLVYDWFGSCDSGDALLVAHFPLCVCVSLSLSVVFLGFFWGRGVCIFVARIP